VTDDDTFRLTVQVEPAVPVFSAQEQAVETASATQALLDDGGTEATAGAAVGRMKALVDGMPGEEFLYFEGAGWLDPTQLAAVGPGALVYANDYGLAEALAAWAALDPGTQDFGAAGGLWVYNDGGGFSFLPG
jgi:hypothetical protein